MLNVPNSIAGFWEVVGVVPARDCVMVVSEPFIVVVYVITFPRTLPTIVCTEPLEFVLNIVVTDSVALEVVPVVPPGGVLPPQLD